jgi:hypothetical protein
MGRKIPVIATILLCTFFAGAETVSLKGTVIKTGGTTCIAGAKVSLITLSTFTTTTGTDGVFTLTGSTTSIKLPNAPVEPIQFIIKGNTISFAPTSKGVLGRVAIFSSDGKMQSSIRLHDLSMGEQSITLPRLSPGINIMRVTVGPESFTRTLICVDHNLVMKNEITNANNGGRLILAKQLAAAAVDTLKAEKEGYCTKKVAIEKYTKDSIAISLDTNNGCGREALKAIADSYVAAQKNGDPSKMPLASQVTYNQNNATSSADKWIGKTALPVDFTLSFFDVDSCRAFVEIISATGSTPHVLMTWLKVVNGKISKIDVIITKPGDWFFTSVNSAKKYLETAKVEDWNILPDGQRSRRQTLINGGNAYLDMLGIPANTIDTVPWGHPCERIEGGDSVITPDCLHGMPGHGAAISGTVNITNRRYAVDVDMGTVDIFCAFGGSMPDSHLFRLIDGKIRLVHTLSVNK